MNKPWRVSIVGLGIAGLVLAACGDASSESRAGRPAPQTTASSAPPSTTEVPSGADGQDVGKAPSAQPAPAFTIPPPGRPPETLVTARGAGCRGFDSAVVQITDDGFETEGASVAPIAADGSWSTTVKMPPAPIPGVDPYPGSWADPDHAYAVTAECVARDRAALRLRSQPFDLLPAGGPAPTARPSLFAGFWPVEATATTRAPQPPATPVPAAAAPSLKVSLYARAGEVPPGRVDPLDAPAWKVVGLGWGAGDVDASVVRAGGEGTVLEVGAHADVAGRWDQTFVLPAGAPPGAYVVVASQGSRQANARFTFPP